MLTFFSPGTPLLRLGIFKRDFKDCESKSKPVEGREVDEEGWPFLKPCFCPPAAAI
jgi:hypothetical protein